jgi:hypothetical protein
MKKVSIVAGKQSRNFSQPKLTMGLDLGDRASYYCVLDESGKRSSARGWVRLPSRVLGSRESNRLSRKDVAADQQAIRQPQSTGRGGQAFGADPKKHPEES